MKSSFSSYNFSYTIEDALEVQTSLTLGKVPLTYFTKLSQSAIK